MIDFAVVATQCNADCRFEQAGWQESPDSIAQLMASEKFGVVLSRLVPRTRSRTLIAHVAAIYALRLAESQERAKAAYRARSVEPEELIPE